jgi:hypothetical protein
MDAYSAAPLIAPPSPFGIDLSPQALFDAGLTRMTTAEALRRLPGVGPNLAQRALIEACIAQYPTSIEAPRSPARRAPLAGPPPAYASPPPHAYAYSLVQQESMSLALSTTAAADGAGAPEAWPQPDLE